MWGDDRVALHDREAVRLLPVRQRVERQLAGGHDRHEIGRLLGRVERADAPLLELHPGLGEDDAGELGAAAR
jgi:hypothetical protein